jgi:hypothetical protein
MTNLLHYFTFHVTFWRAFAARVAANETQKHSHSFSLEGCMKRVIVVSSIVAVVVFAVALFVAHPVQAEKQIDAKFPGAEKHEVTLAQGLQYVHNFRVDRTAPQTDASSFDRGIIDKIMAQHNCAKLKMYYGKRVDGSFCLVLLGVDVQGKDMVNGTIAEMGCPCPPWCGGGSPFEDNSIAQK